MQSHRFQMMFQSEIDIPLEIHTINMLNASLEYDTALFTMAVNQYLKSNFSTYCDVTFLNIEIHPDVVEVFVEGDIGNTSSHIESMLKKTIEHVFKEYQDVCDEWTNIGVQLDMELFV